jgi:hypothetical protein
MLPLHPVLIALDEAGTRPAADSATTRYRHQPAIIRRPVAQVGR